jgi:glycosyltransferase involved in cell wall biosynthesis
MKITVLIPTYKRAELLYSTIASVESQTRPDYIAEVVVSENSTDSASLDVVAQFPNLPIRHVFQTPPVDAGTHFAKLLDLAATEWVALVGDDDMWSRHHLADAVRCIDAHPEAVAYIAQHVATANNGRTANGGASPLLTERLGERSKGPVDCWVYDPLKMGVDSLVVTPFNVWGIVARRTALAAAFMAFSEPGSGHDSDRYMLWLLAQQGPVAIGREIGLFYRRHTGSNCLHMLKENPDLHLEMSKEYTRRIIRDAENMGLPLKETWLAAMRVLTMEERRGYCSPIPGAVIAVLELWGDEARSMLLERTPWSLKRLVADLTPPLAWRTGARLKEWLANWAAPKT